MPPSSRSWSVGIKDGDGKALRADWRARPMKVRRNIAAATFRAIEHILLRHAPAVMPLRTYETEFSALRKRSRDDEGQAGAERQKQLFHGIDFWSKTALCCDRSSGDPENGYAGARERGRC